MRQPSFNVVRAGARKWVWVGATTFSLRGAQSGGEKSKELGKVCLDGGSKIAQEGPPTAGQGVEEWEEGGDV